MHNALCRLQEFCDKACAYPVTLRVRRSEGDHLHFYEIYWLFLITLFNLAATHAETDVVYNCGVCYCRMCM